MPSFFQKLAYLLRFSLETSRKQQGKAFPSLQPACAVFRYPFCGGMADYNIKCNKKG